ncbi:DUF547 domain-containing protein [Flavobacterium sp. UMI-01]|uniref:DUF547 domain-containing protein n=1 Tax=Flavobacterium sp. UMI-01 TaxID=1441053 RepID=UPI001C7CCA66|nr:DUF547 domain-containing protein [Flavobacterium sp. UMI-01]GIZ08020.1 hypothetical protein FUMI01_07470 [Flavobacterium sp. UMI-01]
MTNYPIELSEQLLQLIKQGHDTKALRQELFYIRLNKLNSYLANDTLKIMFWTNIYNAYLLLLKKELDNDSGIFSVKRIKIGYNRFSLNDIEYHIFKLSGPKNFWGIAHLFVSPVLKKLAVESKDHSIGSQLYKYKSMP